MIILGIDPGYAIVGYGVIYYQSGRFRVLEYGAITTPAGMPLPKRLHRIYEGMEELIRKYKPDALSIEQLFFNTNSTTAIGVAEARGCILLSADMNNIPIFEYTPLQVKQAVTGYGRAEKRQIMQMTTTLLGLTEIPKPDDAADALAVAVCHAHSSGSKMLGYK
ncbi:MAG: crossover junction endodeoxyribonuclease RuvC [Clostridia bacterium]|nr:crossover junction endodeoxyribonuclease RuvC [Clostridia bacterium]